MPTRNVVLTQYQASYVEGLVSSGRYQNASEVLREGLRLVEQKENESAAKLEALRSATAQGVSDIEAGLYAEFDSASELSMHLQSITHKSLSV